MHVDEDLAQLTIGIFTGAQIDLVTANDGLLGVPLAPLGQLFTATGDFLDDDLLDDLLGDDSGLFLRRTGFEDFQRLVIILDQRRCQRLAELRAVTIQRVGLDPQFPAQLIGFLAIGDRCIVGHVDRLGDRARDEALRRSHHVDVAVHTQIALALLAAGVGAIEDVVVLGVQMRRALKGHGAADMVVRRFHIGLAVAQMAQQIEGRIVQLLGRDTQHVLAELGSQRPLVEDEADVEGRSQRAFHLFDLARAEAVSDQAGGVDAGRVADAAVTDGIGHDLFDLGRTIAQLFEGGWHRVVDDLEIAASGQFLELHQRKVWLDPRGVAIHHQTDGACGRDHRDLSVAVAVLFSQTQRLVPRGHGQIDQSGIGAVGVIQRHRLGGQSLVAIGGAVSGVAMVADDAQHVRAVALVAVKGPQLARHFGRGGIGHAGHDRGQCSTHGAPLIAVIAQTHVHQKAADIGIAQPQRAELIGQLRDLLGGELRHHHADLQRHGPQPCGMHVVFNLELAVLVEGQQVHGCQIAGRVIQEHVFRAGVRPTDRAIFRAGVPVIDRVMVLDAWIGAGPCGVTDIFPQIACLDRLRDRSVGAADQFPIGVILDGFQESIGDTDRVVRVLARHRCISLGIPVGVIGREFDRPITLLGVVQHTFDIGFRDHDLLRAADRVLQLRVLGRINGVFRAAVPCLDRGEDGVQLLLVHLGAGNDAGNLLLLFHLPVDVFLNIGVVGIDDHHLGRAARGAARLDRASGTVTDFQKAHKA